jgi:hypothetical protein
MRQQPYIVYLDRDDLSPFFGAMPCEQLSQPPGL